MANNLQNKEEKIIALLEALSLPTDTKITINSYETYIVNSRIEKIGMSEEQYKDLAKFLSIIFNSTNLKKYLVEEGFPILEEIQKMIYNKMKKIFDIKYNRLQNQGDAPFMSLCENMKKEYLYIENILYHIVYSFKKLPQYRNAFLNLPYEDLREEREENEGEYIILNNKERHEMAMEYFQNYIDAVDAIEKVRILEGYQTYENWKKAVIDIDGYGHILNSYDGREYKANGYYIYRIN